MVAPAAQKTPAIDRSACPADRHGRATDARNHGCRCADARAASRRQQKLWRSGLPADPFVDGTGTQRRRNALLAAGWSCADIGAAAGLAPKTVKCIGGRVGRTRRSTADRMRAAFDTLSVLPSPEGREAQGRRTVAARLGYVPAHEWVDIDDPDELPDRHYRRGDTAADPTSIHALRELRDDLDLSPATIAQLTRLDRDDVVERLYDADRKRSGGNRRALSADDAYAIRREYVARGDDWSMKRCAARWGVSAATVSDLIHGHIRPELGLTDLTAQPRGDTPAGTPTPGTTRKESAA